MFFLVILFCNLLFWLIVVIFKIDVFIVVFLVKFVEYWVELNIGLCLFIVVMLMFIFMVMDFWDDVGLLELCVSIVSVKLGVVL